jgi:hypothetical protein
MHTKSTQPDQLALTCDLATKAPYPQSRNDSPAGGVGLMPFIGVGTFLVAAHLRLSLPRVAPR